MDTTNLAMLEAKIRNMRNKEDRIVNMVNLVKELYAEFPMPELAYEWYARDRLKEPFLKDEIEELKLNLMKDIYKEDDEILPSTTESSEAPSGTTESEGTIQPTEGGNEDKRVRSEPSPVTSKDKKA